MRKWLPSAFVAIEIYQKDLIFMSKNLDDENTNFTCCRYFIDKKNNGLIAQIDNGKNLFHKRFRSKLFEVSFCSHIVAKRT